MFIVVLLLFSFSTALHSVDLYRMYRRGHHFMLCICTSSLLWLLPINACTLCINVFNVFHFWMSSNNEIQLHCDIPHTFEFIRLLVSPLSTLSPSRTLSHSSRNNRTGWGDENTMHIETVQKEESGRAYWYYNGLNVSSSPHKIQSWIAHSFTLGIVILACLNIKCTCSPIFAFVCLRVQIIHPTIRTYLILFHFFLCWIWNAYTHGVH